MNYKETMEYIHALRNDQASAGLERMTTLMKELGSPEQSLKIIHIAGTNGKGSTAAMTAQILQEAGYRTGMFISPYLMEFEERIQVNGEPISKERLCRLAERVKKAAEKTLDFLQPTEFEIVTAIGFLYFLEEHCDFVVLEVGLGGRFDATNVIEKPLCCAITVIDFDHMALLGNTLGEIAAEKCGIFKSGAPVITYPAQKEEALLVIEQKAKEKGVSLIVPKLPESICMTIEEGTTFSYEEESYCLSLLGEHQAYNAVVVIEICKLLANKGHVISLSHIKQGLKAARNPARLEVLQKSPLVLLDGAHNRGGIDALRTSIETLLNPNDQLFVVMGMVEDKECKYCIQRITEKATAFCAAAPHNPRALSVEKCAAYAEKSCANVKKASSVSEAVKEAKNWAKNGNPVLFCGSLYLAGEVRHDFLKN